LSEPAEARLELVATKPVAPLAAAIARLDGALRAVDDRPADIVDLRLAGEPVRVGDGLSWWAVLDSNQ
jgi:hypothetical protein